MGKIVREYWEGPLLVATAQGLTMALRAAAVPESAQDNRLKGTERVLVRLMEKLPRRQLVSVIRERSKVLYEALEARCLAGGDPEYRFAVSALCAISDLVQRRLKQKRQIACGVDLVRALNRVVEVFPGHFDIRGEEFAARLADGLEEDLDRLMEMEV